MFEFSLVENILVKRVLDSKFVSSNFDSLRVFVFFLDSRPGWLRLFISPIFWDFFPFAYNFLIICNSPNKFIIWLVSRYQGRQKGRWSTHTLPVLLILHSSGKVFNFKATFDSFLGKTAIFEEELLQFCWNMKISTSVNAIYNEKAFYVKFYPLLLLNGISSYLFTWFNIFQYILIYFRTLRSVFFLSSFQERFSLNLWNLWNFFVIIFGLKGQIFLLFWSI